MSRKKITLEERRLALEAAAMNSFSKVLEAFASKSKE